MINGNEPWADQNLLTVFFCRKEEVSKKPIEGDGKMKKWSILIILAVSAVLLLGFSQAQAQKKVIKVILISAIYGGSLLNICHESAVIIPRNIFSKLPS